MSGANLCFLLHGVYGDSLRFAFVGILQKMNCHFLEDAPLETRGRIWCNMTECLKILALNLRGA